MDASFLAPRRRCRFDIAAPPASATSMVSVGSCWVIRREARVPLHIVKWPGPHLNADEEQDSRLSHYCEIGQPQISDASRVISTRIQAGPRRVPAMFASVANQTLTGLVGIPVRSQKCQNGLQNTLFEPRGTVVLPTPSQWTPCARLLGELEFDRFMKYGRQVCVAFEWRNL